MQFSIVVCSHKPDRAARAKAHYSSVFAGVSHELIFISDARSLCEGYNLGFAQSSGELIVFSHDDIEFMTDEIPHKIAHHLQTIDLVGVAGTSRLTDGNWAGAGDPYSFSAMIYEDKETNGYIVTIHGRGDTLVQNIQAVDGCFFAAKRALVAQVLFDNSTFDHFHLYDLDFSFRAYLSGARLGVARDLLPIHYSAGSYDASWEHYKRRFEEKFSAQLASPVSSIKRIASLKFSKEHLKIFLATNGQNRTIAALNQAT